MGGEYALHHLSEPEIHVIDPEAKTGFVYWTMYTDFRFRSTQKALENIDLRWLFEDVTGWDLPERVSHSGNGRMDGGYPKMDVQPISGEGGNWFLALTETVCWDASPWNRNYATYMSEIKIRVHGKLRTAQPIIASYSGSVEMLGAGSSVPTASWVIHATPGKSLSYDEAIAFLETDHKANPTVELGSCVGVFGGKAGCLDNATESGCKELKGSWTKGGKCKK